MNPFATLSIVGTISADHANVIQKMTKATLQEMKTNVVMARWTELFGQINPAQINMLRREIVKTAEARAVEKPIEDGLLTSVWQGKAILKMEEKEIKIPVTNPSDQVRIEKAVQLIFTGEDGKERPTGVTPIITLEAVPQWMHRPLHFFCTYTEENEDKGVRMLADQTLQKLFPKISIPDLADIVMAVNDIIVRSKWDRISVSGLKWQTRMCKVITTVMSDKEKISFVNLIMCSIFKKGKVDQIGAQAGWVFPERSTLQMPSFDAKVGSSTIPIMKWAEKMPVDVVLNKPINPKKGTEGFASEIGWAQTVTGYLGKSAITQMSESRGLSPGLSKQESSVIRFVTVAMAEYRKGYTIKVQGTSSQLLFLATSIIAYETSEAVRTKSGLTAMAICDKVKTRVVASTLGLKLATAKSVGALFSTSGDADSYISWAPRHFSSGITAAAVVKENDEYYTFITNEAALCSRRAVFRQVLNQPMEKKEYLFTDGFPNLFNYWLTNYPDLQAVNSKGGNYGVETLTVLSAPLYDYSFQRARILLCSAFIPDMTRSYRIAAVVGGKIFASISTVTIDSDFLALEVGEGIEESAAFMMLAEDIRSTAMSTHSPLVSTGTNWTTPTTPTTRTVQEAESLLQDLTSEEVSVQIGGDED